MMVRELDSEIKQAMSETSRKSEVISGARRVISRDDSAATR